MQVDNSLEMLAQKNREVWHTIIKRWRRARLCPPAFAALPPSCDTVLSRCTHHSLHLLRNVTQRKREQSFDNENDQGGAGEAAAAARPRKNIKSQGFKYDQ